MPAAHGLAEALDSCSDRLPRGTGVREVAKRCGAMQKELGLTQAEVVRMLTMQPWLLVCPITALQARAQQLAAGLSAPPVPSGTRPPPTARPAGPAAVSLNSFPSATAQVVTSRPASSPAATPAAEAGSPASPRLLRPSFQRRVVTPDPSTPDPAPAPAPVTPAPSATPSPVTASTPILPLVTPEAALQLIARQPALLQVPLERLVLRCHQLAWLLQCSPQEACHCISRLRAYDLERMLAAPAAALRRAWLRLAEVLASLEQAHGAGSGRGWSGNGAGGEEEEDEDGYGESGPGYAGAEGGQREGAPAPRAGRDVPWPGSKPPEESPVARRVVMLCPTLLMLPPGGVRQSALHLGRVLDLPPSAVRKLVARSPQLLLLPPQHRTAALAGLVSQLRLRDSGHAARLAIQQPALLLRTPEALAFRLAALGRALSMPPNDVSRLCRNQPSLLSMSPALVAGKLRRLKEVLRLADDAAARKLALRQPGVLSMSSDAVPRKLRQLANLLVLGPAARGRGAQQGSRAPVRGRRKVAPGGDAGGAAGVEAGAGKDEKEEGDGGLAEARRLVTAEPTLLTMAVEALPRRLVAVAEELQYPSLEAARAAALAAPRLLVLQREALRHKLQELAWALQAPSAAVRVLVRARPAALHEPADALAAALERVYKRGVGRGLSGKARAAAALEALAREQGGQG